MQTNLPLNFKDKLDQFTEQWSPKVIARDERLPVQVSQASR